MFVHYYFSEQTMGMSPASGGGTDDDKLS